MMPDSENADRYLILLEQIQGQVQLISESYEHLNHKIDRVEASLRQEIVGLGSELRAEIRLMRTKPQSNQIVDGKQRKDCL